MIVYPLTPAEDRIVNAGLWMVRILAVGVLLAMACLTAAEKC